MRTLTICAALAAIAASPAPQRIRNGAHIVTTTGEGAATSGPYFIEDAEPGDLIVVTIQKLEPASATGAASSAMTPNAIDAGAVGTKGAPVTWTIDKAKGVLGFDLKKTMPNVDWAARYSPPVYELPLQPVLGSIATAPGGKIAPAAAGSKVLLPVYEAGALLTFGQALARRGDGDVT